MRRLTDASIALLVPLLVLFHLFMSPYSKVEESYNLQATHDILEHGIPWNNAYGFLKAKYDHFSFPGSVPRTFVGPLMLAGVSWPFTSVVHGFDRQILVRAILGLYNAFSILAFRNGIARTLGRETANWYIVLQASQFHLMYYASRTLPNFFAFGLSTLAFRSLLPCIANPTLRTRPAVRSNQQALILWTVCGVVFRSEIAILLAVHSLWLLLMWRINLQQIVTSGLLGLAIGLGLTVPIDSFFWQRFPLWPELSGFIYNVVDGKSADWGISPPHYYFTSALPRLLLNPMTYQVCIPFALAIPGLRRTALDFLSPNVLFLLIYSFQPHKEWRFIVYIIPPLTAVAATGAAWIWTRREKSLYYRILSMALIASTLGSFAASFGMLAISRLNYPGAEAVDYLHNMADGTKSAINVHMDTLSCMTGVTHFLEMPSPKDSSLSLKRTIWHYDKTENETLLLHPTFWDKFDYVLAERPEKAIGAWEIVHTVEGFAGIGFLRPGEVVANGAEFVEQKLDRNTSWKDEPGKRLQLGLKLVWTTYENLMRRWITGGWWVHTKMEPKIRILKKVKGR